MKTLDRPNEKNSSLGDEMGKKKAARTDAVATYHQMTMRLSDAVYQRVERTAKRMGLDATSLVRLILVENLFAYEQRAEKIQ